MNGVQTLKSIRNQENGLCRDTNIIALTGNAISGARRIYQEQGFDGYVEKPIQGKLLEKEINMEQYIDLVKQKTGVVTQ